MSRVAVQSARRRNTRAVPKTTAAFHRRGSCQQAKAETSDATASPELPRIADGKKNATGNHGAAGIFFDLVRTRTSTDLYTSVFPLPLILRSAIPPSPQRRLNPGQPGEFVGNGARIIKHAALSQQKL
jgi:hypothetical protein